MNNVVLIGRLTRDPELRYLPNGGNATARFTLAVDKQLSREKKADLESKNEPTADFINIVVWKDIKGYEGKYQVSNTGDIKSLRRTCNHNIGTRVVEERILMAATTKKGYQIVSLSDGKKRAMKRVHRLVAEAFIPSNGKPFVNHIDGNKQNNNLENLEWVTAKENSEHAIRIGLINNFRMCKSEVEDLYINKNMSASEIARKKRIDVKSVIREIEKHGYKVKRKPKYKPSAEMLSKWNGDTSVEEIMKKLGCKEGTAYKIKKELTLKEVA